MLKVINVVGTRPNFMRVALVVEAMGRRGREFAPLVVDTGQHYDESMSGLRSRHRATPEEINRLLTDQVADLARADAMGRAHCRTHPRCDCGEIISPVRGGRL